MFRGKYQNLFNLPVSVCAAVVAVALATGTAQAGVTQAASSYGPGAYTVPYLMVQPGTTMVEGGAIFNFTPTSGAAGFNVSTVLDTDPLVKLVLDYSLGASANTRITINDTPTDHYGHGIVVGRNGYFGTTNIANMVLEATGVDIILTGSANPAGLLIQGGNVTFDKSSISTSSDDSTGIQSSFGGRLAATDSVITTHGKNAAGIIVAYGAQVDVLRGSVDVQGNGANAVQVVENSLANLTDTHLTLADTADTGWGLYAKTKSQVNFTGGNIETHGDSSEAVVANNAVITVQNSGVSTAGIDSYALYSYDQGQITVSDSTITTTGDNSGGGRAVNGGKIDMAGTVVDSSGSHSTGVLVVDGSVATLTNTSIHTTGADASGIAAVIDQTPAAQNTVVVDGGSLNSEHGSVIQSDGAKLDVTIKNGAQVSGNGVLLDAKTVNGNNALVSLIAGSGAILTGDINSDTNSIADFDLSDKAILTGAALNGNHFNIGNAGQWNMTADSDVKNLNNSGIIRISPPSNGAFKTLTVQGDYIGNNGQLQINTQLGDDSASTDKLVVKGNVSGNTDIVVDSSGSQGAYTNKGILIVDVPNGTSTNDAFKLSSQSTGYRASTGTVSSGGYDYHLAKGGNGGAINSWYLNSHYSAPPVTVTIPATQLTPATKVIPATRLTPATMVTPPALDTHEPQTETPPPSDAGLQVSPEVGSWLGNRYAAETMFAHTFHERKHDAVAYAGNNEVWMRVKGGRAKDSAADGNVGFKTNTALTQLGMDLLEQTAGAQSIKAGVMLGFGTSDTHANSGLINSSTMKPVNVKAKGATYGKSVGAYLTWVQDASSEKGAYVDLTVSDGWYKNTLKSELGSTTYDSQVVSASAETGYAYQLLSDHNLYIEPQAQITFSHYDSDTASLSGSQYESKNSNHYTSRIGARMYVASKSIKPFIETNYVYNSTNDALIMNGNTFSSIQKQAAEIKAGVTGAINNKFNVYAEIISQVPVGHSEQHYTGGQAGLKYSF